MDKESFVEAILADALNIYDVSLWAEKAGHEVLTKRSDPDGTTPRVTLTCFSTGMIPRIGGLMFRARTTTSNGSTGPARETWTRHSTRRICAA